MPTWLKAVIIIPLLPVIVPTVACIALLFLTLLSSLVMAIV